VVDWRTSVSRELAAVLDRHHGDPDLRREVQPPPGRWKGGEGVVREIELLTETQVGLLGDRRRFGPYGLAGGKSGARGKNTLIVQGRARAVPSKCSFYAPAGAIVRVETPGGGGWGNPRDARKRKGK